MRAVSKADVLETYSDLYDVFEDNKAICKELDKIYDRLNTLPSAQSDNGYSDGFADGYKRGLTDAQSEIVRCKDCKHYQFADNKAFGFPVKRCEWTGFEDVDDDDFCSRAERCEE